MAAMSADMGCVEMEFVADMRNSGFQHGIVFIDGDLSGGACYSALGRTPGFTGWSSVRSGFLKDPLNNLELQELGRLFLLEADARLEESPSMR